MMSKTLARLILASCMFVAVAPGALAGPKILGWLERAYIAPWDIRIRAKLDTGARTSSVDARDIETFTRGHQQWVRFTLPIGQDQGYDKGVRVERPVVGQTLIKEHDRKSAARYVVNLDVCVGGKSLSTLVTLADRSNFHYPLILGRTTLQGHFAVDPAKIFTIKRECKKKKVEPSPE